ncbi:MAG: isocitrate lyase/phosphoenolpyruvate mutase family protein [Pseudomonadota bacterium]
MSSTTAKSLANKSAADIAADFRALHVAAGMFLLPNPFDIGSAKLLEHVGFKALATTSGGFAWSQGKLDGAVTREEKLAHCRALSEAVNIPVMADLGPGFGESPKDIAKTVRLAAETGLAGCSIEDAANPYFGGSYEFDLAVERVAAAVEAARGLPRDFVFTARCEEFATGPRDLDTAIKRLQAYEAAGADVLHAPGLTELEHIRAVCDAVTKPVNVLVGFRQFQISADDLEAAGVKRISLGTDLARIAYGAMLNASTEFLKTREIKEHQVEARSKDIAAGFF